MVAVPAGNMLINNLACLLAKLLQLCPTLCDPIDGSSPGSAVPGILQARTLEWVAISFSNAWKWKVTRALILSWGLHPHDLITSQRPHVLMQSHWELYFSRWILRGHKHSVCSATLSIGRLLPSPVNTTLSLAVLCVVIMLKVSLSRPFSWGN